MMELHHWFGGTVEVILISADIPHALETMRNHEISVHDILVVDSFSVQFCIRRRDLSKAISIFEKRGDQFQVLRMKGLIYNLAYVGRRPVLAALAMVLIFVTCWLPSRVLFVRVEGNHSVPTRQIVEQAELCGIDFLASRREVRSERMKNALLEKIPQLQWAGINTYGCTAVITVRERNDIALDHQSGGVSSIIAIRDGIIRDLTVQQGSAQCQVGQAVQKGQVLVSGYTDCGLCIKGTQAKAEVYGDTCRDFSAIYPTEYAIRRTQTATKKKYSLIIGKKRINFFKGSGISGTTCAKIYEEKYFALPGGFVLPIGIAVEVNLEYNTELQTVECNESFLVEFASDHLSGQMQAGMISGSDQSYSCADDYCRMDGIFYCYEMIGTTRIEESVTGYE